MIIPRVNDGVLGDVALCGWTSAVADAEVSDSLVADAVWLVPCMSRGTRMEEWAGIRLCIAAQFIWTRKLS